MQMINYKPTGRNRWDVRVDGRKHAEIKKGRKGFVARIRTFDTVDEVDAIVCFVCDLNGKPYPPTYSQMLSGLSLAI